MAAVIKEGLPPITTPHLFFKSYPEVLLEGPLPNVVERSPQSLDCSGKYGTLFIAGQESLLICRALDVLTAQSEAVACHQKGVDFKGIPHIEVSNPALGQQSPSILAISVGEEFVACDTARDGVPFVVVFKLEQFILQGGRSMPFCEIRGSSRSGSRISGIAWNPGENMGNSIAITCDDGSLQLATIKGEKAVDICSFKDGGVKSMCWSPKGKQLVVGKMDGNLSQLKLDLSEAKRIPGPGGSRIPSSIFWSATTQFLVKFIVEERDVDFMQLDLPKGSQPIYSNFGDIFVSDKVSPFSKCFFIPILQWSTIVCPSSTINDVIVLAKGVQGSDSWTTADIDDNRRAAIPIDSFAVGVTLFNGYASPVFFNEAESFGPMPVVFILSDTGVLCSVSVINADPSAISPYQSIGVNLPNEIFQIKQQERIPVPVQPQLRLGGDDAPNVTFTNSSPASPINSYNPPQAQIATSSEPRVPATTSGPTLESNFLASGLPTPQQVDEFKRVVEERRAKSAVEGDNSEDYDKMALEIEKFQKRFELFTLNQAEASIKIQQKLEETCKKFEKEVLVGLNILEEFVGAISETTKGQHEEISGLTQRVANHFTNVEYADSLAERNKDPRYIQLLRAQPMDPASVQKFRKIKQTYSYVRNQIDEIKMFLQLNNSKTRPPEGAATIQLIYQTLSNHSKILKKLIPDINRMRVEMGLNKCPGLDDDMEEFQLPTMGYFEKPAFKKVKPPPARIDYKPSNNRMTFDDITAGISRVKINHEQDFCLTKSVKISAKKLQAVRLAASKSVDIEVTEKDQVWVDPLTSTPKPTTKELIQRLDTDKMPPGDKKSSSKITTDNNVQSSLSRSSEPAKSQSTGVSIAFGGGDGDRTSAIFGSPSIPTLATSTFETNSPPVVRAPVSKPVSSPQSTSTSWLVKPKSPAPEVPKTQPSSGTAGILGTSSTLFSTSGGLLSSSNFFGAAPNASVSPFQLGGTSSLPILFTPPTTSAIVSQAPATLAKPTPLSSSGSLFNFLPSTSTYTIPSSLEITPVIAKTSSVARKDVPEIPSSTAGGTGETAKQVPSAVTPSIPSLLTLPTPTAIVSQAPTSAVEPTPFSTSGSLFGFIPSTSSIPSSLEITPIITKTSSLVKKDASEIPCSTVVTGVTAQQVPSVVTPSVPSLFTLPTPTAIVSQTPTPTVEPPPFSTSGSLFGLSSLEISPVITKTSSLAKKDAPGIPSSTIGAGAVETAQKVPSVVTPSVPSLFTLPATTAIVSQAPTSTVERTPFSTSGSLFGFMPSTSSIPSSLEITPIITKTSSVAKKDAPEIPCSTIVTGFTAQQVPSAVTPSPSVFGPAAGSGFGSSAVFGGAPTFGSTSPFGSAFGSSNTAGSGFGSSGSSSIFGGATAEQNAPTLAFGSTSPFGSAFGPSNTTGSVFGSSGSSSIFGGATAEQNAPTLAFGSTSPFGSAFGPSNTTGSGFGSSGSSSIFGGTTAQQSAPPLAGGSPSPFGSAFGPSNTAGSGFGSSGSSSIFGGATAQQAAPTTFAFGSTSPFGSAFGSSNTAGSGFGSSENSSIFGGTTAQQAPTFGALAQTAPPQPAFGSFGAPSQPTASPFGQVQTPSSPFGQVQSPSSPFGQPVQQQQTSSPFGGQPATAKPGFGGSAFSSWR